MSLWRDADLRGLVPEQFRLTLGEGSTPVVRSRTIGPSIGLEQLYFKVESGNPTGSYKDRFAAVAVSEMLARGKKRCVATSSGNAGAALAAYCTAAGIECFITIVETAPENKLRQMLAYGARIVKIRGFGLDADISEKTFHTLRRMGAREDSQLQISAFTHSPIGMQGVQSIAYDLAGQGPGPWAHVFSPAGGGGLCLSVARGFARLVEEGELAACPKMDVVQPAGNDTISTPLREGADKARAVAATTRISGLQVPSVIDGDWTLAACRATGGQGFAVSDEDVWKAQKRLAREEGIFTEPAGATALAGVLQAARSGRLLKDAPIACLVTGIGFKDDASAQAMAADSECPLWDVETLAALE